MQDTDSAITPADISQAATLSHLNNFTGKFTALKGGEFNDTFALDCGTTQAILRIARYKEITNLHREARALKLLNLDQVPKYIHYDEAHLVKGRCWIMEGFVSGQHVSRLNLKQFNNLGKLLAQVHQVHSKDLVKIDYWAAFLEAYEPFGNEHFLLNHPDDVLSKLINRARDYFRSQPPSAIALSLVHGDISLGNILVNGDEVSLIDWEYSRFKDPMADFSAMYYEDMEYNKGNWRIQIKHTERDALFAGYTAAGNAIDDHRVQVWMNFDKLGNAIYLYWKVHHSGHETDADQVVQYKLDLDNLIASLKTNLTYQ